MRYYFHYRDDRRYFPDVEGTELSDLDAALAEGRLSARELLGSERGESDPAFIPGSFEITDRDGMLLGTVTFSEELLPEMLVP